MVVTEQLLTKQEVARMRATLSGHSWIDGRNSAMGMASEVKSNRQANPDNPDIKQLVNQVLDRFGHSTKLVSAALPQRIFPPCVNAYASGETYGFHVDAAIMRIPHSQDVLRSDVSMTLFLSEPQEYDGGELHIATEFGLQSVKLPAGHAVLYPSGSLHRVTPVTKGERLAVISWIQSLISDAGLRATLYQLDQSIQALLSAGNVDRQALDQLHNVYHNLIRRFCQP